MRSIEDCQAQFGNQLLFPFAEEPALQGRRLQFELTSHEVVSPERSPVDRTISFSTDKLPVILGQLELFLQMHGLSPEGRLRFVPVSELNLTRSDAREPVPAPALAVGGGLPPGEFTNKLGHE